MVFCCIDLSSAFTLYLRWHTLQVATEEGVGAFYKGYATYVVRITPHIMITWIFLEVLNDIEMLK